MATKKSATPWGKAVLLDEVVLRQQAPGPRAFSTHVQLLETDSGERLVRLAYATAHGWVRRGPATMQLGDPDRPLDQLAEHAEPAPAVPLKGACTLPPASAR